MFYQYDENNIARNDLPINVFGAQQTFSFPTLYAAKNKAQKLNENLQQSVYQITQKQVLKQLEQAYYNYQTQQQKLALYQKLDSIYAQFAYSARRRF